MHPDRDISSPSTLARQNNLQVTKIQTLQTKEERGGEDSEPAPINARFYQNSLPHNILSAIARRVCREAGIDYNKIPARERFLLVRFRCAQCGMQPLYLLDLQYSNKAKCLTCSQIVSVKNRGKYGKIRKRIAIESFRITRLGEEPFSSSSDFSTIA